MFKISWLDASSAEAFARELAAFVVSELAANTDRSGAKFSRKAEKTLNKAAARVLAFRRTTPLNFYQRSKLANAFLWALKDAGCPTDYADELTEWLTVRL